LLKKSNETSYFQIWHSDYHEAQLFHIVTESKKKKQTKRKFSFLKTEKNNKLHKETKKEKKGSEAL